MSDLDWLHWGVRKAKIRSDDLDLSWGTILYILLNIFHVRILLEKLIGKCYSTAMKLRKSVFVIHLPKFYPGRQCLHYLGKSKNFHCLHVCNGYDVQGVPFRSCEMPFPPLRVPPTRFRDADEIKKSLMSSLPLVLANVTAPPVWAKRPGGAFEIFTRTGALVNMPLISKV